MGIELLTKEQIKENREKCGFSRKSLAEILKASKIKISEHTLNHIENGKTEITMEISEILREAFYIFEKNKEANKRLLDELSRELDKI